MTQLPLASCLDSGRIMMQDKWIINTLGSNLGMGQSVINNIFFLIFLNIIRAF